LWIGSAERDAVVRRGISFENLEYTATLRSSERSETGWSFGIAMEDAGSKEIFSLSIYCGRPVISIDGVPGDEFLALQDLFDWNEYHQLRLVKRQSELHIYIDDLTLGTYQLPALPSIVRVDSSRCRIAVDSVKGTRL